MSGTTLYYRAVRRRHVHGERERRVRSGDRDQDGNAGYTFSSLGGFLSAAQTGNHVDVTFDGSSNGAGTFSVAANNNAGVASTPTSFDVVKDNQAPTGGGLSINPYSGSLTVPVAKTDFTDAAPGSPRTS